jgi:crotonobetaine/carnitine-CoA ligase
MSSTNGWSAGEQTTILDVFRKAVERRGPDFKFVDYSGETYTFDYLDRQSTRLAHGLREAGAQPQECVTSILDNGVEQLLLLLACSKIGAIHVPLNTAFKGEFLRHQVSDSGAVVLVAEKEYVDRLIAIEDGLPDARVLLVKGDLPGTKAQRLAIRSFAESYSDRTDDPGYALKPGDTAMLIYTAGTTGLSKGCMVSQNYVCNMARQIGGSMLYGPDDVVWTPLPGFHMNQYTASIVPSLIFGGRVAIYPRFSVTNYWPEIERTGATVSHILSTMVSLIADAPDNDASRRCYGQLRVAAGAPFPPSLQKKWKERFNPQLTGVTGFGLTECALVTSCDITEPSPPTASGRRNEFFDVRIVDDDDHELPPGASGEVIVRPRMPHVMFEGYWRRPAETVKVIRNLWFHTGDIGKFDEDGFFYFLDRKKDYLRRRGENISSMELEAAFRAHPQIAEVVVHAVLAGMEDDVKVTAVLVSGEQLSEESLCRWSIDNLPYFAVPRFVEFRSELPKNPVGRVLKYQLREEGVTAATWDREKSDVKLVKR